MEEWKVKTAPYEDGIGVWIEYDGGLSSQIKMVAGRFRFDKNLLPIDIPLEIKEEAAATVKLLHSTGKFRPKPPPVINPLRQPLYDQEAGTPASEIQFFKRSPKCKSPKKRSRR